MRMGISTVWMRVSLGSPGRACASVFRIPRRHCWWPPGGHALQLHVVRVVGVGDIGVPAGLIAVWARGLLLTAEVDTGVCRHVEAYVAVHRDVPEQCGAPSAAWTALTASTSRLTQTENIIRSYYLHFDVKVHQRVLIPIYLTHPLVTGRNEVVAKVIFLHLFVILFRGVCLSACWDTPRSRPPWSTPPRADTPPEPGTPPGTKYSPPGLSTPPGTKYTPPGSRLRHMVNEQPVRILLSC